MRIEKTMGNQITPYTISVQPQQLLSKENPIEKEFSDISEKKQLESCQSNTNTPISKTYYNEALPGKKRLFPPSHVIKSWV